MNIIVTDKSKLNVKRTKKQLDNWLKLNFAYFLFEMHYKDIKRCIIAEEFLSEFGDCPDYKFMCFNGKVEYFWVDMNRHDGHIRSYYDRDFNGIDISKIYDPLPASFVLPKEIKEMIELSEKLSASFNHVRVDFYNINGKILFGEMTFTSAGGFRKFSSHDYELYLGSLVNIKKTL